VGEKYEIWSQVFDPGVAYYALWYRNEAKHLMKSETFIGSADVGLCFPELFSLLKSGRKSIPENSL